MGGRILVVGLTCVDIVNYVQKFPVEDSDSRVMKQIWSLGGNAANNVTVLNQLNGGRTTLFSALPKADIFLKSLMERSGVSSDQCILREKSETPLSTVIVNESNGTRTIMHYRGNLEELTCDEFRGAFPDVSNFSWIHFEGRNFDEVFKMINYVRERRGNARSPLISIECEKVRAFATMEQNIPLSDVIFVSKDFARSKGFLNKEEAVVGIQEQFGSPNSTVICPWGEKGAAGRVSQNSDIVCVDAYVSGSPAVDTLAAGDCFIACCIHSLNEGIDLRTALTIACRITGKKVTKRGLLALDVS